MNRWAIKFLINAVVFYGINVISDGAVFRDYWAILWAAAILVLLNAVIKPILSFFSLPLTCITFGLFGFVVNGLVIAILDFLMPSVRFQGFWQYILTAVLIAAASALVGEKK